MPQGATALSILAVCTANMCRSVRTAHLLNKHAGDLSLEIFSAGTETEPGEHACGAALRDPLTHRSQQLEKPLLDAADLVLVMEAAHRRYVMREAVLAHPKTFLMTEAGRLFPLVLAELERVLDGADSEWLHVPAEFASLSESARMLWFVSEAHEARQFFIEEDPDVIDTHGPGAVNHPDAYALIEANVNAILGSLRALSNKANVN